ncbi:MAG TPA: surface-adhesin E family protein [Ramlibacter sp.]|nr:surface-adhesin E family protein [Ramlibacter sp.]
MSKQIALTILIALASVGAHAEWVLVNENDQLRSYLDFASARKEGDLRRVWGLEDFKRPGPHGELSALVLTEWDCTHGRRRFLSSMLFSSAMTKGTLVGQSNGKATDWDSAGAHTFSERVEQAVCSR